MKGHKFIDIKKQRTVRVEDVSNNIATLNSGERISVERLMDLSQYRPEGSAMINESDQSNQPNIGKIQLDTSDVVMRNFGDDNSRYQNMIDNQGTGVIGDDSVGDMQTVARTPQSDIVEDAYNPVVENHRDSKSGNVVEPTKLRPTSTNIGQSTEEELLNKYKNVQTKQVNPNSVLAKIGGEEFIKESKPGTIDDLNNNTQPVQQPVQPEALKKNPMHEMFKKAKKSQSMDFDLKISEKIPDKEVIKMFEENFDESAVDFYTKEILDNIMSDPNKIEKQIKDLIKKYLDDEK